MSNTPKSKTPQIGDLEPPAVMPSAIAQRIKNLTCPPPIMPSKVSNNLNIIKQKISEQTNHIANLEKQVSDLESRINISFSAVPEIKYDLKPGSTPYIGISGTVENVVLDFHMWPARNGLKGIQGEQGEQGIQGQANTMGGTPGIPGYYGIRGNYKK